MTTPVCESSKSYLVRQNVTILVKKYGYFGCLLRTKVTNGYMWRLEILFD